MICLSVNVNKIATLRNARGGGEPSVTAFASTAMDAGVHGITVHPRPDERHITQKDVFDLVDVVRGVEFNIEGYPDARYMDIVRQVRPTQATLVPDPPNVLTSNAGWKAREHMSLLQDTVAALHEHGARVSLFMETDPREIEAVAATGAERIEFYTGPFAEAFARGEGQTSFKEYARAADTALAANLEINAGHDLNLDNLVLFRELPGLQEVSIGHALTCDALVVGWKAAVGQYLEVLRRRES